MIKNIARQHKPMPINPSQHMDPTGRPLTIPTRSFFKNRACQVYLPLINLGQKRSISPFTPDTLNLFKHPKPNTQHPKSQIYSFHALLTLGNLISILPNLCIACFG
jgi:hypothetical protein